MTDPRETYHVDTLNQDSLAVTVDLLNNIDLSLIPASHNADPVTFGEEDMPPLFVLREARWVQDGSILTTVCSALKTRVSHRSKRPLFPIFPAILSCCLELTRQRAAEILPCPPNPNTFQQFLSFMSFVGFFKGLLPRRSCPLDNSLHIECCGPAMAERCLCLRIPDSRIENWGCPRCHVIPVNMYYVIIGRRPAACKHFEYTETNHSAYDYMLVGDSIDAFYHFLWNSVTCSPLYL